MATNHIHANNHDGVRDYFACRKAGAERTVELACGHREVHHRCGHVDRDHDIRACDAAPVAAVSVRGWVAPDTYRGEPARFPAACEHGLSGRICRGPAHYS